jgi:phage I-like protein
MNQLAPLLNRAADGTAFQLPDDGWYQIAPAGEYPVQVGADTLTQVLDTAAFDALANRFRELAAQPGFAGLLIDYDHFSMDLDKPSEAAGWITDIANRDGTLWAEIRWSDRGGAAVTGGSYRFLSPVFDRATAEDLGNGRVRPTRLLNAGLTNDPNLKTLAPLTNRSQQQESSAMNPALLKSLGLPEDATEAQAAEAIDTLRNRATAADTAEAELAALKQTALETQVEADLKEYAGVFDDKEVARTALLANRDQALTLLKALKPAKDNKTLPNRRQATIPDTDPEATDPEAEGKAVAIRNRAAQIQRDQGLNYTSAWNLAQTELG